MWATCSSVAKTRPKPSIHHHNIVPLSRKNEKSTHGNPTQKPCLIARFYLDGHTDFIEINLI